LAGTNIAGGVAFAFQQQRRDRLPQAFIVGVVKGFAADPVDDLPIIK